MPFQDLREFMQACDDVGELVTIDQEVDWNLEVGAISRRICEIGAPMAHMTNIRGIKNGGSILGSPMSKGWQSDFARISIALELDPASSYEQLMDAFMSRMDHTIRPLQVKGGPCKENILTGDEINLFDLPAPYLHEGDGGRYIDTFGVTATRDPESDWVNWGVYRHMIHKKVDHGWYRQSVSAHRDDLLPALRSTRQCYAVRNLFWRLPHDRDDGFHESTCGR